MSQVRGFALFHGWAILTRANISDKLADQIPGATRERPPAECEDRRRKGRASMSKPLEDSRISRRGFLRGAAGVAGSLAVGSLTGPELARAIPRRRLAPTKIVLMGKELTADDVKAFQETHPNIAIELLTPDAAKFQ